MVDTTVPKLEELLLDAMRAAAKRGGPYYLSITSTDTSIFSGCLDLKAVAEAFLRLVSQPERPQVQPGAAPRETDADAFEMIDKAVRALTALERHGATA